MAITEELRLEIKAQSQQAIREIGKVQSSTGGLAKSFKALGVAAAAALAVREITKYAKQSVEAFKTQQTAVNNLNTALAATGQYSEAASKDMQRFASEMQGLTVVGDEATLGILQLGLNMGLTAEQAKEAAQGAIGMSRAYGVDLTTAMRATSAAVQGNTSLLSRYMPQIRDAQTEGEKLAIVQASLASAFEVAKGETLTLAGAQQQMKNALGDLSEIAGGLLAPALQAMAVSIRSAVEGFQEFVSQEENVNKIASAVSFVASAFAILFEVGKQTFNVMIEGVKIVLGPIAELASGVGEANFAFDILAGAMEIASSGFRVIATIIKEQIETVIQFGKAAISSFEVIRAGVDRVKGDISKEEFRSIARDAGNAWAGVGEEMLENFTEPFKVVVNEGRSFLSRTREQADEYRNIWATTRESTFSAISGQLSGNIAPSPGVPAAGAGGNVQEELESNIVLFEDYYNEQAELASWAQQIERNATDARIAAANEEWETKMALLAAEREARVQTSEFITSNVDTMYQNLATLAESGNEKAKNAARVFAGIQKAEAVFSSIIKTKEAVNVALASAPPPFNYALAAAVGAFGAANTAFIAARPLPLAEGGIVMPTPGGTIAQIAEAGKPEAVIPLDKFGSMGATYNIYVSGVVGDIDDVAVKIYEAMQSTARLGRIPA